MPVKKTFYLMAFITVYIVLTSAAAVADWQGLVQQREEV